MNEALAHDVAELANELSVSQVEVMKRAFAAYRAIKRAESQGDEVFLRSPGEDGKETRLLAV